MVYALEPQWVGTAKRVYLRGEDIFKEVQPKNIRFSHLMVRQDRSLSILRGGITKQGKLGSYTEDEAPVFMSNLPSAKAVADAKNVDDLQRMFGPQRDYTDAWGDGHRIHSTERWTWFTADGKDTLRYLNVFAQVSWLRERKKPADIDILYVTEGLFRPADPTSAAERIKFKTGEELEAEYEADRAKDRAKYPFPLRSLVEAKETPEDPGAIAYTRALNEVRGHPSPELFGQFAEWIDEGTSEIRVMLEIILFDDPSLLELDAWQESQRKVALRALADALPRVKTAMGLDDVVLLLLRAHGGGELNVAVTGTDARIAVKAYRFPVNGSARYGSQNVSSENLSAAAEQCRQALKDRYPDLR
jgi:hypothetical protein